MNEIDQRESWKMFIKTIPLLLFALTLFLAIVALMLSS